jgi:hypothetical protein
VKPSVIAAAAFVACTVAFGAWLLSRPRAPVEESGALDAPSLETFTFAAWAARGDAVLLVEMQPEGDHFAPRRFHVIEVSTDPEGKISTTDGAFLSWAPADRLATNATLLERAFPMTNDQYRPYPPAADPLSGDAPAGDSGSEQAIVLRSRGGLTAVLRRRRSEPLAAVVWGKRALAFPNSDEKLAYVIPDKVIVRIGGSTGGSTP